MIDMKFRGGHFHSPFAFCDGNSEMANDYMYTDRKFCERLCLVAKIVFMRDSPHGGVAFSCDAVGDNCSDMPDEKQTPARRDNRCCATSQQQRLTL